MQEIIFQDEGFEQQVRKALKKPKGKLEYKDLYKINGILISDDEVNGFTVPWEADDSTFEMKFPKLMFNIQKSLNGQWVKDITLFKHIKTLHIYISTDNLEWIQDFHSLEELYIVDSNNTDWSFIENLIKLEYLYIQSSPFSDLTPIGNLCKKQQDIYLKAAFGNKEKKNSAASYISFNKNYKFLSCLAMTKCGISDISPLAISDHIYELNLSHNKISDLTPLSKMESLYYLTLRYNKISEIKALANLSKTLLINLRHNNISDISVFNGFKDYYYLGKLYLQDNPINDYSPLKNLYLTQCDIEQYSNKWRLEAGINLNKIKDGNFEFNIVEKEDFICVGSLIAEASIIQWSDITYKLARETELEISTIREVVSELEEQSELEIVYPCYARLKGQFCNINTSYITDMDINKENNKLMLKTCNSLYVFKIHELKKERQGDIGGARTSEKDT